MKVLSLFDGMSCGQIALKQLGIIPERYYASEVDKHAIKQTQLNFPDTIQLGDVTKWKEWDVDWKSIDLILAGSPCQGFSFAGKQLAFDDPRSKLFFVFIDILNHIKSVNPDVLFLLENVNMKRSHMRIISEYCGVFPVNINSNLVSAQNRDRWYWTNIRTKQVGLFYEVHSDIPQPRDKGIFLRDILESEVDEKYYVSDNLFNRVKGFSITDRGIRPHRGDVRKTGISELPVFTHIDCKSDTVVTFHQPLIIDTNERVKKNQNKSSCFTAGAHSGGYHSDMDLICVAMRGREASCLTPKRTEYGKSIRKDYEAGKINERRGNMQQLEPRSDGKTNCITSVQKDNFILQRNRGNNSGGIFEGKTPTLSACSWEQNNLLNQGYAIRRLTPIECSRLQTIPSWYRWKCSDTQIYKMLGNGWTVDVIVHILSFMKEKLNINVA